MITGEMTLASVQKSVHLSIITDFEETAAFIPAQNHLNGVKKMFDQLIDWTADLKDRKISLGSN